MDKGITLKVRDISKSYDSKKALNNFSYDFTCGVYALLGANGAGKTSLINIITGLLKSDKGTISPVNFIDNFHNCIGYLPQNQDYYPNFTGLEFLLYMIALKKHKCDNSKTYAMALLEKVNLMREANKKIRHYSGGMKQRLGIAQALIGEPKLLIFDEPTAGLDPEERIRFRNLISYMSEDRIIIISTHIVSDIAYISKEIVILDRGNLILSGTQKSILDGFEGKVWELKVSSENIDAVINNYKVSNIVNNNGFYNLRIVSDTKPLNAVSTSAMLEDVCLYYFNK